MFEMKYYDFDAWPNIGWHSTYWTKHYLISTTYHCKRPAVVIKSHENGIHCDGGSRNTWEIKTWASARRGVR